jgi:ABC-type spermidine/putrescine transport system permease subunit I
LFPAALSRRIREAATELPKALERYLQLQQQPAMLAFFATFFLATFLAAFFTTFFAVLATFLAAFFLATVDTP